MAKLIYIIEDDDFFYSLEEKSLTDFKFIIKRFNSFRNLNSEFSEQDEPVLAIVDYFLANQYHSSENGIHVVQFLRNNFPHIKIIVLSAQILPEVTYDFIFKYRVNAYIHKDKEALLQLRTEIQKLV